MSYFPDMGTATMAAAGPHVRAVGWLDADYPYPIGTAPPDFRVRLKAFAADWSTSARLLHLQTFLGGHDCEFCRGITGFGCFAIPAGDILFVAPDMVSHYVERHGYLPPEEFVAAVLQTPAFGSPQYASLVERFRDLPISEEDHLRIGDAVQSWSDRRTRTSRAG